MSGTLTMFQQTQPLILDMSHLKRGGVLANPGKQFQIDIGVPLFVHLDQTVLTIYAPRIEPDISLEFDKTDKRFWNTFQVRIFYRELNFGYRPYFVCPTTKTDCLKLVIIDGMICAHSAYRMGKGRAISLARLRVLELERKLLMEDGRRRRSPHERKRIVEQLLRPGIVGHVSHEAWKVMMRERRKENRNRRKAHWESRSLSTTKAYDNGRGMGQDKLYEDYMEADVSWLDALPDLPFPGKGQQDYIQNFPEFDVKVFLRRYSPAPGKVRARQLGWPLKATGGKYVAMFIDEWSEGLPRLVFCTYLPGTSDQQWQEIQMLPGPNSDKPRYFLCPVTRARCEVLYYREGYLASRQAHNLRVPKKWLLKPPQATSSDSDDW